MTTHHTMYQSYLYTQASNPAHYSLRCLARLLLILLAIIGAGAEANAQTAVINVNSGRQTIDGFGGSSAWHPALSDAQMDALFGNGNNQQLGLTLLRIRIDPNRDWGNETSNAQKAHARGARVLGSPWTPPPAMKNNNNVVGGRLDTGQYDAFANYLAQAANSIGLDYVSIQNEPDIEVTYESAFWSSAEILSFIRDHAQKIGRPVVMPESFNFNDTYSDPTLNDPTAVNRVAILGGHIYGNGLYRHSNAISRGKKVWMTEHYHDGTALATCIAIAKEITDCMANDMNAYIWWWMAYPGSQSNIISGSTPLKNGYVIGQFAKWIRPGYVRVDATYNPSPNVYVTAYKNGSGQVVIVAVNTGSSSVNQVFTIQNGSAASVTPYRTSGGENIATLGAIAVLGGSFTATLPGQSVTTFVQSGTGGGGGQTIADGTYRIVARHSGKSLDVSNNGTANGTQLVQWPYHGGNNQRWNVTHLGNGQYRIMSVSANRALEVSAGSTADGARIQIWDYFGGNHQKWTITPTSDGYYRISPVHDPGSSLDVSGVSQADGAIIQLWRYGGGNNQQWVFQAP